MANNPLDDEASMREKINKLITENNVQLLSTLKNMNDINDMTREVLQSTVEEMRKSGQSAAGFYTIIRDTKSAFTDINTELIKALEIQGKLGTEYIKQKNIKLKIDSNQQSLRIAESELQLAKDKVSAGGQETALQRLFFARIEKAKGDYQQLANIISKFQADSDIMTKGGNKILNMNLAALVSQKVAAEQLLGIYEGINDELYVGNKLVRLSEIKVNALAKAFGFLADIPIFGKFLNFKNVAEAFTESWKEGWKELGKEIKYVFTNPIIWTLALIAAVKKLFEWIMAWDKSITDISNNLAISKDLTEDLFDNFRKVSSEGQKVADNLDEAFLSVHNMAKATQELQDSLGTNAMFTQSMLQNQTLMTKQMGMSAEEAAGIQKLSLLTGKSAESILQSSIKQNNAAISYRKILKEISSLSAELTIRYGNDPEKIAAAVVQANKLGMSLEETRKISDSLLNFETSIEGELESELLLGKQFNFEKARELALMGKSSDAAGELLKQVGGTVELEKMNVIQRQRLASAIGLSADELSKAAIEQSVLNNLGIENRKGLEEQYEMYRKSGDQAGLIALQEKARRIEGGGALLQDIAKANVQQRFEESMEKIKDLISEIASGPMLKMLDGITKFLSNTTALKIVLASLVGIAAAIAVSMAIATGGAALLAGAAAGAMTYGALSYGASDASGIKAGGPKLSSMPNANNSNNYNPAANQNSEDKGDNPVVGKLDELINHIKKGGNVYIDSTSSGRAYGMSFNSYA